MLTRSPASAARTASVATRVVCFEPRDRESAGCRRRPDSGRCTAAGCAGQAACGRAAPCSSFVDLVTGKVGPGGSSTTTTRSGASASRTRRSARMKPKTGARHLAVASGQRAVGEREVRAVCERRPASIALSVSVADGPGSSLRTAQRRAAGGGQFLCPASSTFGTRILSRLAPRERPDDARFLHHVHEAPRARSPLLRRRWSKEMEPRWWATRIRDASSKRSSSRSVG